MASPRVSCVVPVFNGERFLGEALESILTQTCPPDEIVVVDDGSTDGSAQIATALDRVRYIRQENAGPAAARNSGIGISTGDLLAFLDADDLWLPTKLERQLAQLEAQPALEFSVTLVQNFWMPELAAEATAYQGQPFARPQPGFVFGTFLGWRRVFERVGPVNPALRTGEDVDWFLRASESGLTHELLPDVLVRRRLHRGNLTRADLAGSDALLGVLKDSLERRRKGAG